jgi:hypothetical protein
MVILPDAMKAQNEGQSYSSAHTQQLVWTAKKISPPLWLEPQSIKPIASQYTSHFYGEYSSH